MIKTKVQELLFLFSTFSLRSPYSFVSIFTKPSVGGNRQAGIDVWNVTYTYLKSVWINMWPLASPKSLHFVCNPNPHTVY